MSVAVTAVRRRAFLRLPATAVLALAAVFLTACVAPPGDMPEIEASKSVRKETATLLIAGKYDELDKLEAIYRKSSMRTASGQWMLAHYYAGFRQAARAVAFDREEYVRLEEKFLAWAKRSPQSTSAHIGYAMALLEHAWYYRGYGPPEQVLERNWGPFYSYLGLAYDHMIEHAKTGKTDPHWYRVMMIIARAQAWKPEKFQELFEEAAAAHPYYHEIWYGAADYLMPRWYGSFEQIAALASDAVGRTGDREGAALYARIYWYISQAEDGRDLIATSKPVWQGMSASFDDLLERWPDQWNINNYARLACLARDRKKTRDLLARMDEPPLAEAWERAWPSFEACRNWADG